MLGDVYQAMLADDVSSPAVAEFFKSSMLPWMDYKGVSIAAAAAPGTPPRALRYSPPDAAAFAEPPWANRRSVVSDNQVVLAKADKFLDNRIPGLNMTGSELCKKVQAVDGMQIFVFGGCFRDALSQAAGSIDFDCM
jgi:hypothetical protein